ncbi:hypothetical protein ACEN2I_05635 [Flavobacterium sp. W22_SRS_FK3]|uniref:hypothetical protein n=1 Tax=Flavobacterium sp. W22_SRS_FK3 TaxID=3240275 RepID=UPI003F8E4AC6
MHFVKAACNSLFESIKAKFILANLTPFELVFLQNNKLEIVVHGVVNNLIGNKKIEVLGNNRLNMIDENLTDNKYENCVIEIMRAYEPMPYPQLFKIVEQKSIFEELKNAIVQIRQKNKDSKQFMQIIKIAMLILGLVLSIGIAE